MKRNKGGTLDYAAGIITILWLSYIFNILRKANTGIVGTLFICGWGVVLIMAYIIQKGSVH